MTLAIGKNDDPTIRYISGPDNDEADSLSSIPLTYSDVIESSIIG